LIHFHIHGSADRHACACHIPSLESTRCYRCQANYSHVEEGIEWAHLLLTALQLFFFFFFQKKMNISGWDGKTGRQTHRLANRHTYIHTYILTYLIQKNGQTEKQTFQKRETNVVSSSIGMSSYATIDDCECALNGPKFMHQVSFLSERMLEIYIHIAMHQ
jgi:hypothetical protein